MTEASGWSHHSSAPLAKVIIGADVVKNEISSHARPLLSCFRASGLDRYRRPGLQDCVFKDGHPVGFNMNTVCAAGTGRSGPPVSRGWAFP